MIWSQPGQVVHKTLSQKTLQKKKKRNVLNTKVIYDKHTANTLNGEKLKAFSLRSGTLQFSVVLEVLIRETGQEKEMKSIQIRKEVKLSLFTNDMILHVNNLYTPPKTC
jgi:hypothetical protein